MPPINAQTALLQSIQTLERANTSIQFKANWLRQHRSNDPIQQMQTDAIVDLCAAVQEIQLAIGLIPTIILPDVSAVRAAAEAAAAAAAGKSTVKSTTATKLFRP